jgi:hypothetical protein
MGTMSKIMGILLLLCFCFSCFIDNENTQYVAVKKGKGQKLEPLAKIVYKVSIDRQQVIYWVEVPNQDRSQLYKLKNCIVANSDNWEGEIDDPLWVRVEVVNGKFRSPGGNVVNVTWWTWHFETDPSPSYLKSVATYGIVGLHVIGLIIGIVNLIMDSFEGRGVKGTERQKYPTPNQRDIKPPKDVITGLKK